LKQLASPGSVPCSLPSTVAGLYSFVFLYSYRLICLLEYKIGRLMAGRSRLIPIPHPRKKMACHRCLGHSMSSLGYAPLPLSSCVDSCFALELTAALSSFMRCLEGTGKVADLGSAVWHPKPLSFCCRCKRCEAVSGCWLERY